VTKYAISKWTGGAGILLEADNERQARELAADWIRDEPVAVRAVEEYEPPRSSRASIPPSVSACLSKAREHTRSVDSILGGVRLPERRST
jgi:hypothetical protein